MEPLAWLVVIVGYGVAIYVTFDKGKNVFGWLGIAGVLPPLAPLLVWFPLVGALRLAKPDSGWARRRYGPAEVDAARRRFPQAAVSRPPAFPPAHGDAITRFITGARESGVIDATTQTELLSFLEVGTTPAPRPAVEPATVVSPQPPPRPGPPPLVPSPAPSPPVPSPPRPSSRTAEMWHSFASDVALHGFAYLGVALTFVGVLGFLLFAFADVPDAAQPVVELFIAVVFFGWSWFLRRQGADVVGTTMELVGGMVLPLVVFAGFVDDGPFPPDFEEGGLVLALTVTAVVLAGVYAAVARRNPESALRFLVGPLLWLAALTAGFVLKTDEPLTGDAITRLVSHQPAMASAAIAVTLGVALLRSSHPLARPTMTAALVGIPAGYLLTVSLSVGEGWRSTVPVLVLGVSTFVSAELLGRLYGKHLLAQAVRPFLLAGVLAPLVPLWGIGWAGLAVALAYLGLFEWTLREGGDLRLGAISALASVVGGVMSLAEPWAGLVAFVALSSWAHVRRARPPQADMAAPSFLVAASVLPVGIAEALQGLLDPAPAWLTMALIVMLVAAAVRWWRPADGFLIYWGIGAAWVVVLGTAVTAAGVVPSEDRSLVPTAFALLTLAVTLPPRWPALRVWMGTVVGSLAIGIGLVYLEIPVDRRAVVWALAALVLVVAAGLWRTPPSGHLAAAGHLVGALAAVAAGDGWMGAVALGAWAAGWVVSVIVAETERESFTALLERAARRLGETSPVRAVRWVAPLLMIASIPPAVVGAANQWERFAANRSWTGLAMGAIAVAYAVGARTVRPRRLPDEILGIGATVAAVIGVSVAAPDSWPTILAAAAVIGVAVILTGELPGSWFVWFAWVMSGLIAVLAADLAGVPFRSLNLVVLVWGTLLLLGGLVVDEVRAGSRRPGEGIRVAWTRYPIMVGALAAPLGLGPVYAMGPRVFGWWSIGAAGVYLLVAYLLRAGAVSGPAYGLAAAGVLAVTPWPFLDEPWRLAAVAAPLVGVAWLVERVFGKTGDLLRRWDVPPLVVAHLVAGLAFAAGIGTRSIFPTFLVFGALSMVVGMWRRQRAWIDAGNVLVLAAAWDAGPEWLALALLATSIRGVVGALLTNGAIRLSYQFMSVAGAGGAWIATVVWRDWDQVRTVSYSALAFGALALLVAGLARFRRLELDFTLAWGGLALVAFIAVGAVSVSPPGSLHIDGPWLGAGLTMLALAFELVAPRIDPAFRYITVLVSGPAWSALVVGVGWAAPMAISTTAVVFGVLAVAAVEEVRGWPSTMSPGLARSWTGLGALGVVIAGGSALARAIPDDVWLSVAAGLGLLSIGTARGARPLGLGWLREASPIVGLAALSAFVPALGASAVEVGWGAVAVAVISVAGSFAVWWLREESPWVAPLIVLGSAANLEAVLFALGSLPAQSLLIGTLLAIGIQAAVVGLIRGRPGVLAVAPPAVAAAFVLAVAESVTGSAQWYTVPMALVLLSEVEILRWAHRVAGRTPGARAVLALEWTGIGLLAAPSLVEMFTAGPAYGLTAFGLAAVILLWAVATRVRRRVIASAALTIGAGVLVLFAAATAAAPGSAFLWVLAVGIGFAVMLVAAFVEAYRSRRGHVMLRLDQLMEGWE